MSSTNSSISLILVSKNEHVVFLTLKTTYKKRKKKNYIVSCRDKAFRVFYIASAVAEATNFFFIIGVLQRCRITHVHNMQSVLLILIWANNKHRSSKSLMLYGPAVNNPRVCSKIHFLCSTFLSSPGQFTHIHRWSESLFTQWTAFGRTDGFSCMHILSLGLSDILSNHLLCNGCFRK